MKKIVTIILLIAVASCGIFIFTLIQKEQKRAFFKKVDNDKEVLYVAEAYGRKISFVKPAGFSLTAYNPTSVIKFGLMGPGSWINGLNCIDSYTQLLTIEITPYRPSDISFATSAEAYIGKRESIGIVDSPPWQFSGKKDFNGHLFDVISKRTLDEEDGSVFSVSTRYFSTTTNMLVEYAPGSCPSKGYDFSDGANKIIDTFDYEENPSVSETDKSIRAKLTP